MREIDLMARAEMVRMRSDAQSALDVEGTTSPIPEPQRAGWLTKGLEEAISELDRKARARQPDIYVGPTMARKIAPKARPITLKIDLDPEKWEKDDYYMVGILNDLKTMIDEAIKKGNETDENA